MYRIPTSVMNFATEANIGVYKMFGDYFSHYRSMNGATNIEYQKTTTIPETGAVVELSFSEKEEKMNQALKREILRVTGISNITDFPLETWASHPTLRWATFAVVNSMIDMVLPQTIIDSIGLYTEMRVIPFGDSAAFDIVPRDLFAVSKAGRGKRTAELKKQFNGQVVVVPENHMISVAVSLYKVLAGKESLASFVMKAVRSIETAIAYETYDLFAATMAAIDNTASTGLRVAGYTAAEFTRLSQTVAAWNGGGRPVAIGTQAALVNILPADANYRYDLDSDYVKLGYVRNFLNTDVMVLPQLANYASPFGLKLSDSYIWIISPSSNKLIKCVLEGSTLAYTDEPYANANLIQSSTLQKSWGLAVATNAVAATISL
jgi:hypothetical protein